MRPGNPTLFFAGMSLAVLGSLIVTFDYPQVAHLEAAGPAARDGGLYGRLVIEMQVGAAMLCAGAAACAASVLRRQG